MRAQVFGTLVDAEAAQRAIDVAAGLPMTHAEGSGPTDFEIPRPGAAAVRIRARGVRTLHSVPILAHPDGLQFALPSDDAASVELDASWFAASATRRG